MAEKREWKGITLNETMFQGKLLEDPVFVPMGDGECVFMKLRTFANELGSNGQWTETTVLVPLVVLNQGKVDVVRKYVKAERELFVRAYYKSWKDDQGNDSHGFVVTQIKLGSKGFPKSDEDVGNAPPALG